MYTQQWYMSYSYRAGSGRNCSYYYYYWQCIGFGLRLDVERNKHFIKLVACKTDVSSNLLMENYVAIGTWNEYVQYQKNLELNLKKNARLFLISKLSLLSECFILSFG